MINEIQNQNFKQTPQSDFKSAGPLTKNIIIVNNNQSKSNSGQLGLKENINCINQPIQMKGQVAGAFPGPSLEQNSLELPEYNKNVNYLTEFWKMFFRNELVIKEMKEYSDEIKQYRLKADRLEEIINHLQQSDTNSSPAKGKIKKRRTAQEISKDYTCPYSECKKSYGSDVSLNLHIKLKHNGGNKTEREKLARQIILSQVNGEIMPDVSLNLPPGFMEVPDFFSLSSKSMKKVKRNKNKEDDDKDQPLSRDLKQEFVQELSKDQQSSKDQFQSKQYQQLQFNAHFN